MHWYYLLIVDMHSCLLNEITVSPPNSTLFTEVVNQTKVRVTGLPMGTKITLSVAAVANYTLEGDKVTVVSYTGNSELMVLLLLLVSRGINHSQEQNIN